MDVTCTASCRFYTSSWNLLFSSSPAKSFTKNATRFIAFSFFFFLPKISITYIDDSFLFLPQYKSNVIVFFVFFSFNLFLGGIHLCEARRRFLEGSLHPANVLMCPHTCVTNLPKPRELHHGNCFCFSSNFFKCTTNLYCRYWSLGSVELFDRVYITYIYDRFIAFRNNIYTPTVSLHHHCISFIFEKCIQSIDSINISCD